MKHPSLISKIYSPITHCIIYKLTKISFTINYASILHQKQADKYTVMETFPKLGTGLSKKKEEKNILLNLWLCFMSTMEFKSYDLGKGTVNFNCTNDLHVAMQQVQRSSKDAKKITVHVQHIVIFSKIKV
jgi:hypothetical protein